MDLRSRIRVDSSWETHGDITAVLYIVSSSGGLLDEPLPPPATPISLTAPTSDPHRPCRLNVDLASLRGYIPSQIELTTTSRTTELYHEDDDYIGTVRGSVAGSIDPSEGGVRKLYCCNHVLPSEVISSNISIKLLSLRGMAEVLIEKIQLVVREDHGGSASTPPPPTLNGISGGGVDMHQLLHSLPVGSLPPFMQTLVSSLTNLSSQASSGHTASGEEEEEDKNRPAELSQLMDTLRRLRPPPPSVTAVVVDSCNANGETTDGCTETETADDEPPPPDGKTSDDDDMETRLRLYIDEKFEQLERRLEKRLEELLIARFQSKAQHTIEHDLQLD